MCMGGLPVSEERQWRRSGEDGVGEDLRREEREETLIET